MPQDPATVEIGVNTVTQVTKLLASYGIYALVVLFMFYQQHRERKNLAQASSPEEKKYYQQRSTLVLWVTIVLSVVAAGVWFYATFIYKPKIIIEGTLKNLREQPTMPVSIGDPPMVTYRLEAFRGDVQFYSSKQASLIGSDLNWILVSPRGLNTVELSFQQEYCSLEREAPGALLAGLGQEPLTPKPLRGAPIKTAKIDFGVHEGFAREQIHLVYQPDDDIKSIGKLFLVHDGVRTEIPWTEDSPGLSKPSLSASTALLFGTGVAWAQSIEPSAIFGPNGEISQEMLKRLKLYLESDDLKQQLVAQEALVEGGYRSFPATRKILSEKSADHHSRNRLVHNVASAVEKIEGSGTKVGPELTRALAVALFEIGNYELAARFFDKIPTGVLLTAKEVNQSAISALRTQRYEQAKRDFMQYIRMTSDPRKKSMAVSNIGAIYVRTGDLESARAQYSEAVALDSKNVVALLNLGAVEVQLGHLAKAEGIFEKVLRLSPGRPSALNSLAYVYALQDKNLDQALAYADLALKADGEDANFLDTKGWVLYKLGRPGQGLPYLEQAFARKPNDAVIKSHLEEAKKAASVAPGR